MDLNFKNKQLLFFTWFTWSLLLILSLIYAEERILNIDGGFILSKIINDPDDLPHHIMRPVMMMVLTIPMLLAKLSIKGKFLIYLISLLQVSISGFCIYWINHRIKKPKYSLGLLLTLILFGNYSFYWSIGELVYGMCFFWTWIAMIENEDKFSLKEIPWIFLWATCHPTVFFVVGFYVAYRILFGEESIKPFINRMVIMVLSIILVKLIIFQPYEKGKMGLIMNVFNLFPNYFKQPVYFSFLKKGLLINIPTIILFVYGIISLWKISVRKAIFCLFGFLSVLFVLNACYYFEEYSFYLEANYTSLSFIIAFIIIKGKEYEHFLIKGMAVIKIAIICWAAQYWVFQLDVYKSIQDKLRNEKFSKLILLNEFFPREKFYLTDVSGYISICLNNIEPNKKQVHFVVLESEENVDLKDTNYLITKWEKLDIGKLYNPAKQKITGTYIVKKEKYYVDKK